MSEANKQRRSGSGRIDGYLSLGVNLSRLEACQNACIQAEQRLNEEIKKTLDPMLAKCKTREDVNALRRELFERMSCPTFDGILCVHFAIAWSARDEAVPCDHPSHNNPGLITPCPSCGVDR